MTMVLAAPLKPQGIKFRHENHSGYKYRKILRSWQGAFSPWSFFTHAKPLGKAQSLAGFVPLLVQTHFVTLAIHSFSYLSILLAILL
jgi:hypothetical protein